MIEIKLTDKWFYDSPEPDGKTCLCSRCLKPIPKNNRPLLRIWPTGPGDHGYDAKAKGGTEFRFCWSCSKNMGVDFGTPEPDPDYWE